MASLTESELPQAGRTLRWRLASDQVLARAAATGADGAFDEIFARYQPALVRHCRAVLLDADEAQDAAQNALTSALRALRRGTSEPVSLKAWLYRIAHNEAVTLAKRRADQQARRAPSDDAEAALAAVAGPADDDTRERVQELVRDLRDLPERQRNALLLRELSGLAYDEVADVIGTSPGAARQTVFEARAALIDIGAGRDDACIGVRRTLSDGDGRVIRGRRVRAHLRGCGGCTAFAAQIDARERDLAIAFPLGPVLALFGGGAGAASLAGGTAVAGAGWSIGLGSSVAVKCATVCAAAALFGAAAIENQPAPIPTKPHKSSPSRDSAMVAAAPRAPARRAAIVLGAKPVAHVTPRKSTAKTTHRSSSRSATSHVSLARSPKAVTAHVPKAVVPHRHATTEIVASVPPPAASTPAPAKAKTTSYALPQIAVKTIAAVQQHAGTMIQQVITQAQTAVQQSLSLAQQIAARFFGRSAQTSADAPASPTTP